MTTFYINSRNKSSGTHSDFTYRLELDPNTDATRAVVLEANIPKSYYLIPDGYNTLTLTEGIGEGETDYTITIPAGNYNRKQLKTKLKSLLDAAGDYTYTISYQTTYDDGLYSFSSTGDNSSITTSYLNIAEALGIEKSTDYSMPFTSPNVIKLIKEDCLYLHSDLVQSRNNNVLQTIYTQVVMILGIYYLNKKM